MRYWDTSAIVPLYIVEPSSVLCTALRASDPDVATWALTPVEATSAFQRRLRRRELDEDTYREVIDILRAEQRHWEIVRDIDAVADWAAKLLEHHALRAADAVQLAAALLLTDGQPAGFEFVTCDGRLASAAAAAGFTVVAPHPSGG